MGDVGAVSLQIPAAIFGMFAICQKGVCGSGQRGAPAEETSDVRAVKWSTDAGHGEAINDEYINKARPRTEMQPKSPTAPA